MPDSSEPVLRTLAPALGELQGRLSSWLGTPRHAPLSTMQKASLIGLGDDLNRQSQALKLEQPLLIILFMGGTGVGKSSLLNALAGGAIAHASFARPTTRDPVVYYHSSLQPARLDPALQLCRLASHDRPGLEHKILVDTPDLDSNDLSNREKLLKLLPVADIVLYVGSQEKYHDQIGWDVFLQQRKRRAFAFVLNKWDRCQNPTSTGVRPDQDLLKDLEKEGFQNPLLFRTCAQHWIDHPWQNNPNPTPAPVEGEQFLELVRWLENGLNRLEIDAIKARGVGQLLKQLDDALTSVTPPDLTEAAQKTQAAWRPILREEARHDSSVLLGALEPFQKEIEHHFALERQKQFRGFMATYLYWFNRLKYSGSSLKVSLPFGMKMPIVGGSGEEKKEPNWDLVAFTQSCSKVAGEQHLDARTKALANRLLVEADNQGFPLSLLTEPTEVVSHRPWRAIHAQALADVLGNVEHAWSKPTGPRRWIQGVAVFLADWLPVLACGGMVTMLLWGYTMSERQFAWGDLVLPLVVMVLVVIILHVLIAAVLPLGWQSIRKEFEGQLEERLLADLDAAYTPAPEDLAKLLTAERRKLAELQKETREVAGWLREREESASIVGLYGK